MTPDASTRAERLRTTAVAVWTAIGVLALATAGVWILWRISAALVPFIIAGVIAFLLHAPVNWLESKRIGRGWGVLVCYAVVLALLAVLGVSFFPSVARQLQAFAAAVPGYLTTAQGILEDLQREYSRIVIPEWFNNLVSTAASDVSTLVSGIAERAGSLLVQAGTGVATGMFDVFLGVVLAFWLLKDLPTIKAEIKVLAGPRYEEDTEVLISTVDYVVGGYLKGQTIASLVTGVLATIGLAAIGVPYALVLGLIVFVLNYIPYVGPLLASLLAATVALFVSPLTALLAVLIILGAQNLTDSLVTPKVMSQQVNLHPTFVIFSLLVGGTLFGIPGMLFAIPIAALVQGLFVYYYERRTRRQISSEDGALFKTAPCPPEDTPCDEAS